MTGSFFPIWKGVKTGLSIVGMRLVLAYLDQELTTIFGCVLVLRSQTVVSAAGNS